MYNEKEWNGLEFKKNIKEYTRTTYSPFKEYTKCAQWVTIKKYFLDDPDLAVEHVKQKNKGRLKDPTVVYFERQENKDRLKRECNLSDYLAMTQDNNYALSPTGTAYNTEETSVPSTMMKNNKIIRSKKKYKAFQHEVAGEMDMFAIENQGQVNTKLENNSLSGIVGILSSFLYCDSYHPTLTSTTRMITSIANGVIERFLAGNRHYYNLGAALGDVSSICSDIPHVEDINDIVSHYNLHIASNEETLAVIKRNCDPYWKDRKVGGPDLEKIVMNMTTEECQAYVYTGSFWDLLLLNDTFARNMLDELMNANFEGEVPDVLAETKKFTDYQVSTAAHFFHVDLV